MKENIAKYHQAIFLHTLISSFNSKKTNTDLVIFSDEEKRAVEGDGWHVLFIPVDGSPAAELPLGIVQTYPRKHRDIKITLLI